MNHRKMLLGRFLLGLDDEPPNREEKKLLRAVLDEGGKNRLGTVLGSVSPQVMAGLPPLPGTLDLVDHFAEPYVTKLTIEFFGLPAPGAGIESDYVTGTGERLHAQWIRKIASTVATSEPAPFGLQRIAEKCREEFMEHCIPIIQAALQNPALEPLTLSQAQTVLDGIIIEYRTRHPAGNNPSIAYVMRNLGGLLMAGNAPIIKSFVHAIDQLLRRQDRLQHTHRDRPSAGYARAPLIEAINAAQTDDRDRLRKYVLEAMRFNPTFPLHVRSCPRAEAVSERTPRKTVVPAGGTVFVPPIAAMFDRETMRRPESFAHDRPESEYLLFGYGGHVCLGAGIAKDVLTEMTLQLLSLQNFDLVQPGRFKYDGPTIDHYRIEVP
jgi:cytochrome P450